MNLLDRWRIARLVDAGKQPPISLARRIAASPFLSDYIRTLRELDRALANSAVNSGAPAALHSNVLSNIQARVRPMPDRSPFVRRAAMALAAIALIGTAALVFTRPSPPPTPPIPEWNPAAWARSIDAPDSFARTPVEAPLVREARLLVRDTRRAADMVLASLPSPRAASRTPR